MPLVNHLAISVTSILSNEESAGVAKYKERKRHNQDVVRKCEK